jgi:hypothetical protein
MKAAKGEMSDVSPKVWCDLCSLRIAPYEGRIVIRKKAYHIRCHAKLNSSHSKPKA